jgi:hypothetical protein
MNVAILIAVAISHLATTGLLIREIEANRQLRYVNNRLKDANRRLFDAAMPTKKVTS